MKILLDEGMSYKLSQVFGAEHEVFTVYYKGWSGKKNGELLRLIVDGGFDIFVTVDQNLSYQQNLDNLRLTIVVLKAVDNRTATLQLLIPKLLARLADENLEKIIIIA
jgi:hypothetical protein